MSRILPPNLCTLILCIVLAGNASATTYYIAANGSDSSNGTSKTTPWMHAPGMAAAAGNAASTTIHAGDSIIFRGGDTWYFGTGGTPTIKTSLTGTGWNASFVGNSSASVYIGVDQTWYTGSSWARPILSGGNPLWGGAGFPSSCTYDDSNLTPIATASYQTWDNFEMKGICWSFQGYGGAGFWTVGGTTGATSQFENIYCHGWTLTSTASDQFPCFTAFSSTAYNVTIGPGVVVDGSDSPHWGTGDSHCATQPGDACATGQALNGARFYDVHGSVFRYLSNIWAGGGCHTIHDNLFEYVYESPNPVDVQHPNVLNCLGGYTGDPLYFYNNIIRHTHVHEDVYLAVRTNAYVFNNVFYDNMTCPTGCSSTGFFRFNQVSNSSATTYAYIYNNTMDNSGMFNFDHANSPLTAWNGTGYFENNHLIGFSPATLSSVYTCQTTGTCTIADSGNEVFQTVSVANGQGYTASNNYAPASGSVATVGAGVNLTGSCPTFSSDGDLCSGTSGSVAEANGSGGQVATYPAVSMVARPPSAAWNVGAYEYSSAGQVNPPTNLTATVH